MATRPACKRLQFDERKIPREGPALVVGEGMVDTKTYLIFRLEKATVYFRSGPVYWSLQIRLWVPTVILGCTVAFCLDSLRRRVGLKKLGLCLKCGYDLRASKYRCPECGTAMQESGAFDTMADGHDEPDHR